MPRIIFVASGRRWVGNPSPFPSEYLVNDATMSFLLVEELGDVLGRSANDCVNRSELLALIGGAKDAKAVNATSG